MILNYIKIAYRSLLKNKGYSFLNIFGLAIGITCASLIFLWVEDEVSFNTQFPKQDHVFYLPTNQKYEGKWRTFYSTPGPLAADLKNEIPGIIRATRSSSESRLFSVKDKAINRTGRYADADIFEIFSLHFIEGNTTTAFNNPEAIVLTQTMAETLFGKGKSAMGEIIKVNNRDNYVVTGIIEDLPQNITFKFDWLAPFERYRDGAEWMTTYGSNFSDTFIELSPTSNRAAIDAKVRALIPQKIDERDTYAWLHSIKDWHLRSRFDEGKIDGGRITYVRLFTIIALIILFIACINFMNLATARSEKRANEVGVRKAMGSSRSRLMIQFIIEALMMSFMALAVSILALVLLLPQFNLLIGKSLILNLGNPTHLGLLLTITVLCGLFAGLYPAFYLSSFKPVEVLKGIKATNASASFIRKGLVIGQFTVSIVFIIATLLVYQQVQFIKNRDLGYDKEQLVRIKASQEIKDKFRVISQDLKTTGMVINSALCNSRLLDGGNNGSGLKWEGGTNTEDVLISFRRINSTFFETTGIEIKEGRGFKDNIALDSTSLIVSESLANLMGKGSAVGKTITGGDDVFTVVGVAKDYQYDDIYSQSSAPVIFLNYPEQARFLLVKTVAGKPIKEVLTKIEAVMKVHNPAYPFEYTFVDEEFNSKFESEQLIGKLSQVFALLAIIISCLGLFGLSAYTAEQRSKEIGVRKVLGSSVSNIVMLLSKDFLKLVIISIVLAFPLAWLIMNDWLQDFAYRIEINWWIFIIAGFLTIFIAMLTVSFQAIKSAIANPVHSLKTE